MANCFQLLPYLFQQLSGKPSDDKILDLTLGEESALRIKKLFPTLHKLGESVEVLRAAKAEWTKGNSMELQVVAKNDPQALNDAPPSPVGEKRQGIPHPSKTVVMPPKTPSNSTASAKKGADTKTPTAAPKGKAAKSKPANSAKPPLEKSQKNATPAASDGSLTDDEGLNTVLTDDWAADPREDTPACSPLFLFLMDEEDEPPAPPTDNDKDDGGTPHPFPPPPPTTDDSPNPTPDGDTLAAPPQSDTPRLTPPPTPTTNDNLNPAPGGNTPPPPALEGPQAPTEMFPVLRKKTGDMIRQNLASHLGKTVAIQYAHYDAFIAKHGYELLQPVYNALVRNALLWVKMSDARLTEHKAKLASRPKPAKERHADSIMSRTEIKEQHEEEQREKAAAPRKRTNLNGMPEEEKKQHRRLMEREKKRRQCERQAAEREEQDAEDSEGGDAQQANKKRKQKSSWPSDGTTKGFKSATQVPTNTDDDDNDASAPGGSNDYAPPPARKMATTKRGTKKEKRYAVADEDESDEGEDEGKRKGRK
ncbi:hypothetical protein B0H13DRAFT_1874206 [Mycena leptocephala]|nr:hypothetical protein B0H13DRAFT_1874206 [Mycena leptocephala]